MTKGLKMYNKIVRSFNDIEELEDNETTIVTLFSGGLDSSFLLAKLSTMNFKKIIAVVVDLGEEVNIVNLKTITSKLSIDLEIIDAKYEFAEKSVIPAIQAQAKYLGLFPVSSSLSRPVIAKKSTRYSL